MYLKQLPLFKNLNPYSGEIDQNNRWIKVAELVPWREIEGLYLRYFHPGKLGVIKNSRLIVGLMLGQMIEEKSDREIVAYFHENPYFQYFCGCDHFVVKLERSIIHHSLLSKRRSRLGDSFMKAFEGEVLQLLQKKGVLKGKKLILDATVFPSKITYPNDVKLLNTVREWGCATLLKLKQGIDPSQKIRTYRKTARKVFLRFQKIRRKTSAFIRKTRNSLLRFTKRNLDQLETLIGQADSRMSQAMSEGSAVPFLSPSHLNSIKAKWEVAKQIVAQQGQLAKTRGRRVADRIVSFHQPQVRPIVRGKEGKSVEFGPKAHVALVDGYAILDQCQYDNFHEGIRLPESLKQHHERFGTKPERLLADQIYATHANRTLLQEQGIEHAFKRMGRPPTLQKNGRNTEKITFKKNQGQRNAIEATFGHLKERFNLRHIVLKVKDGAHIQIRLGLISRNLLRASSLA